jgi:two-component system cell cycle sensor histidine kinase/response regulator CckA
MKTTESYLSLHSDVKEIQLNWLSLRFTGATAMLEAPFRAHFTTHNLLQIRVALLMGALMYGFFGILDALLLPQHKHITWLIRYAFVCPAILAVMAATFFSRMHRYLQPIMSFLIAFGGLGIVLIIIVAPAPISYYYYAGLILIFMFGYSFIYLRFLWASLSGWYIVILYEIAAALTNSPALEMISNSFFLVSGNLAGMLVGYTIEYSNRRNYFLMQLLAREERKIKEANDQLEQRVAERTAALEEMNRALTKEITERQLAEGALRESEEIYRTLIERSPDAQLIIDDGGNYVDCNQAALDILRMNSRTQLLGLHPADLSPERQPDGRLSHEKSEAIVAEILAKGSHRFEWVHRKADGEVFHAAVVATVVNHHGKTLLHLTWRDITDRKRAEEERITLTERLHDAEKMELLGKLAGRVAHDLNNVLGVLSGYSELLTERIPAGNPLREYATNILKSSGKAAAIVEDLLTLTRRGVRVMEVAKFNKIIADLLATPEFDNLVAYHPNVIVKTDLAKDLLNISGSPVHIEKTVMNLVSNAVEAIVGDGEVIIKTENRYLDKAITGYQTVAEGEYVVLMVSDKGKGIPASELKKIFEPFYTKKSMGRSGTGLGLAIVWGAVQDHNGYIDVQSIEGKGTTFTLYFPATREKAEEEAQKIPIEQYIGHGESVLVVDDVQEQREVATTLLTQLGYSVNAVSSGEAAVKYLKSNKADILVLDMIMDPGIDGLDTYKLVLEINPLQKAIIVSGFSETDRSKEAQRLGAGAYVKKPYLKENIGVAIRDELARK